MKRKKFIAVSCICFLFLLITYISPLKDYSTIFLFKDNVKDDYGGGKVKYPSDKIYAEPGLFDLKEVQMKKSGNEYIYSIKVKNLKNDKSIIPVSKNGFSFIQIDSYIGAEGSIGYENPINYGSSIAFKKGYPWQYHIRVNPSEAYMEQVGKNNSIKKSEVKVEVKDNVIIVHLDKTIFSAVNFKNCYYYIFASGYDILGPDKFKVVNKNVSASNFGGGDDGYYDPNIIDVIGKNQEKMLQSYMPPNYASMEPIKENVIIKSIYKEYVYLFAVFIYAAACLIIKKSSK